MYQGDFLPIGMAFVPVRGGEFLLLAAVIRRAGASWPGEKGRSPVSDILGGGPSNPSFGGCPRSDLLPGLDCALGSRDSTEMFL